MPVNLKGTDISKKGWQALRHKELKACGMGEALEGLKSYYNQGAAAAVRTGKTKDATSKCAAVTKAVAKAKIKVGKIKDNGEKRVAKETVEAYENLVAGFADELLTAAYQIRCQEALDEVKNNDYTNGALSKLTKAEAALQKAQTAVERQNAAEAISQHGIALNQRKGATECTTKTGLKKRIQIQAKKFEVAARDINQNDPELKRMFKTAGQRYTQLTADLNELDDAIDLLTEQLANKEPETSNSDTAYKQNLKKLVKLYKGVVDDSKKGLAKVRKHNGDISKLETILSKTVESNASALVQGVVKVFNGMLTEYKAVDKHIQDTIRESTSTYNVQAAEWGITREDKGKNTLPLMNRAFALNYQCKNLFEKGSEKLIDVLEQLVSDFDNDQAKSAIGVINRNT